MGFDFDGTLVNSLDAKIKNAGIVFSEVLNIPQSLVVKKYKRYSGVSRRSLFDNISLDIIGRKLEEQEYEILDRKFDEKNSIVYTRNIIYPNTLETLDIIKSSGMIIYLSSSVPQNTLSDIVRKLRIENYFKEVLGSEENCTKGIEHAKFICKQYSLLLENIAFVGDETADMKLAKNAGILPIGITNTTSKEKLINAGAGVVISKINELINMLGRKHKSI